MQPARPELQHAYPCANATERTQAASFTIPDKPDWIPYRTSYYKKNWGFCLSHNEMLALRTANTKFASTPILKDGSLTYGECFFPGRSTEEVLISCHACHPSLANDNLSGITRGDLARGALSGKRSSLFVSLSIHSRHNRCHHVACAEIEKGCRTIRQGLVLTGIGDKGRFHYKRSRQGDAEIDRAMAHVLCHPAILRRFWISRRTVMTSASIVPRVSIFAVGCLMRSVWGTFPEYHTSADNLEFIHPLQLASRCASVSRSWMYLSKIKSIEICMPYCEPQLGRRESLPFDRRRIDRC